MALIIFYENNGEKPKKCISVKLCYVLYHIQLFVYWLSIVSFKNLKLHFIQTKIWTNKFQHITRYWNSRTVTKPITLSWIHKTVILNFPSRLVNNYLSKGFYINEKESNQKLCFQMMWNWELMWLINWIQIFSWKIKAISFVANTITKMHIQKNMYLIYKQDFYKDEKMEIDKLFIGYLVPIMDDIDHHTFIEEWK